MLDAEEKQEDAVLEKDGVDLHDDDEDKKKEEEVPKENRLEE